jgi:hypothetical protein
MKTTIERIIGKRGVTLVGVSKTMSIAKVEKLLLEAYTIGYEDGAGDAIDMVRHIEDGDDDETAVEKVIQAYRSEQE